MAELIILGLDQRDTDPITLSGLVAAKKAQVLAAPSYLMSYVQEVLALRQDVAYLPLPERPTPETIAGLVVHVDRALEEGRSVVRALDSYQEDPLHLRVELEAYRQAHLSYRVIPSRQTMIRQAFSLNLPWLHQGQTPRFQLLHSAHIKGDQTFWSRLARADVTLALDLGSDSPHTLIEQLMLAGADGQRNVALASHHPLRSPMCWLTSLDELETFWPQWSTDGATILYLEPARKPLRLASPSRRRALVGS